jgi:hypothetical protein
MLDYLSTGTTLPLPLPLDGKRQLGRLRVDGRTDLTIQDIAQGQIFVNKVLVLQIHKLWGIYRLA